MPDTLSLPSDIYAYERWRVRFRERRAVRRANARIALEKAGWNAGPDALRAMVDSRFDYAPEHTRARILITARRLQREEAAEVRRVAPASAAVTPLPWEEALAPVTKKRASAADPFADFNADEPGATRPVASRPVVLPTPRGRPITIAAPPGSRARARSPQPTKDGPGPCAVILAHLRTLRRGATETEVFAALPGFTEHALRTALGLLRSKQRVRLVDGYRYALPDAPPLSHSLVDHEKERAA